jgi:hypothetical protein
MKRKLSEESSSSEKNEVGHKSQDEDAMDLVVGSSEARDDLDASPAKEPQPKRRRLEVEANTTLNEALRILNDPIHTMAKYQFLRLLLDRQDYTILMNGKLLDAVQENNVDYDKITSLLKEGADINVKNEYGNSALALAIYDCNFKFMQFLLDNKADTVAVRKVYDEDGEVTFSAVELVLKDIDDKNPYRALIEPNVGIDIIRILSRQNAIISNEGNKAIQKFLSTSSNPIVAFVSCLNQDQTSEVLNKFIRNDEFDDEFDDDNFQATMKLLLFSGAKFSYDSWIKFYRMGYRFLGNLNDNGHYRLFDTVTFNDKESYALKKEFRIDWKEEFEKTFHKLLAPTKVLDSLGRTGLELHNAAKSVGQVLAKAIFEKDITLTAEPLALVAQYLSSKDIRAVLSTARHSNIGNVNYVFSDIHTNAMRVVVDSAEELVAYKHSSVNNALEVWRRLKTDPEFVLEHFKAAEQVFFDTFNPEQKVYWQQWHSHQFDQSTRIQASKQFMASLTQEQKESWQQLVQRHKQANPAPQPAQNPPPPAPPQQDHWGAVVQHNQQTGQQYRGMQ